MFKRVQGFVVGVTVGPAITLGAAARGALLMIVTLWPVAAGAQAWVATDIPHPHPSWVRSRANAVSDTGEVVGWKDLAVNFGPGVGVWVLRQTSWTQLHGLSAESMASGDLDGNGFDDLVLDFGEGWGVWVWMNSSSWLFLNSLSPTHIVTVNLDNSGGDEVVFNFPGVGLWVWKTNPVCPWGPCNGPSGWEQLHPANAIHLAAANLDGTLGEELIVNFQAGTPVGGDPRGQPVGLWTLFNNNAWVQLHGLDVTTMTTADLDNNGSADLIASSPAYGVWAFRAYVGWSPVHSREAQRIAALHIDAGTQIDLVFDFGAGEGLWTYRNGSVWAQVTPWVSQGFAVGDFDGDTWDDLVVGFGDAGLWKYSNGAWSQLHGYGPGGLATTRLH